MQHDPRPHIHRRGRAAERLRSLTTATAIAGLAGTAGFGLIAAASWSGNATVTAIPAGDGDATSRDADADDEAPVSGQAQPDDGGGFAQPPVVAAPRQGRGSGHASTGGSH